MSLYQLTGTVPSLHEPDLIVALEGWVDAGAAATTAAQHVAAEGKLIAVFDPDALFDYRARRPMIDIADGRFIDITWPTLNLTHARVGDRDVLVLTGHEPDYRWREFSASVAGLATRLGVSRFIALGGIGWAAPHTRPTRLLVTTNRSDLLLPDDRVTEGPIRVPGAAVTVLDMAMDEHGLPTVGLWAQVPHYVTSMYAPAVIALLERLGKQLGAVIPIGDLAGEAQQVRASLDVAVAQRPEVKDYVERLEQLAEEGATGPQIPTGDEIASEIERFLREQSN
jgi:hypothetical protein